MAHFAKVIDNKVTEVIVAEQAHIDTLDGTWIQTSYNNEIRNRYAGVGYTYDSDKDVFYPPSPYASWKLKSDYTWEAPTSYPTDGKTYTWDGDNTSWVEFTD